MRKELILRAKELHRRGYGKMRILELLVEIYGVDTGTAGSHVQVALDEIEDFDNAEKYRYWYLFGGIVCLLLSVAGIFLIDGLMNTYHILILGSISLSMLRKGWQQLSIYKSGIEEKENSIPHFF